LSKFGGREALGFAPSNRAKFVFVLRTVRAIWKSAIDTKNAKTTSAINATTHPNRFFMFGTSK